MNEQVLLMVLLVLLVVGLIGGAWFAYNFVTNVPSEPELEPVEPHMHP